MNLTTLINHCPYDLYFLVVDQFLDIKLPELTNFQSVYSQAKDLKNSGFLLSKPETLKFIINNSQKTGRLPAIIPFKPSAKIEHLCRQHHWYLIANPAKLNRLLEDKLKFPQLCKENNLPTVPFAIDNLTSNNFSKYQRLFSPQLVIQTHFGWAGKSTFSSESYANATKKLPPNTLVKFSPHLRGYTLLNNCCLTRYGLIQSPPALQYTGLKPFTDNPFATVGRQWPSFAPKHIQNQVFSITQSVSLILNKLNYRGFFGLDFLVHQNRVYLLECNPRLTASFAFYTQQELQAKLEPLFFYHLAEFLNLDYPKPSDRFDNPDIIGSELTPKNAHGATIKQLHWNYPLIETPTKIDLTHVQI